MRLSFLAAMIAAPLFLAACGAGETSKAAAPAKAEAAKADPHGLLPTDMIMGDPNAPVTLIEYASLTCPVCGYVATEILPGIEEKFVKTGKVRLVFREFPTHNPKLSLAVSVLTRCASEKTGSTTFFPLIEALFRSQSEWEGENRKPVLEKIFGEAGLPAADLDACLKRQDLIDLVNENARTGAEIYEIEGTPSFIMDGKKLQFRTAAELEQQIAAAVGAAGK